MNASTTSTTATPGGTNHAHLPRVSAPASNDSSRIRPQDQVSRGPTPRNDSVVSRKIAAAMVSVVLASTSPNTLGSTCRRMIRALLGAVRPRPVDEHPLPDRSASGIG